MAYAAYTRTASKYMYIISQITSFLLTLQCVCVCVWITKTDDYFICSFLSWVSCIVYSALSSARIRLYALGGLLSIGRHCIDPPFRPLTTSFITIKRRIDSCRHEYDFQDYRGPCVAQATGDHHVPDVSSLWAGDSFSSCGRRWRRGEAETHTAVRTAFGHALFTIVSGRKNYDNPAFIYGVRAVAETEKSIAVVGVGGRCVVVITTWTTLPIFQSHSATMSKYLVLCLILV